MRSLLATALLALFPCFLAAQSFVGGRVTVRGGVSHFRDRGRFAGPYFPAFYDPFDLTYLPQPDYSVAAQPPVVVMQQTPAAKVDPAPVSPPAQPLLIELQGDRYVRVTEDDPSDERTTDPRLFVPREPMRSTPVQRNALLVFRDGHREQISGYTIAGNFLYASGDYYTVGSWSQQIPLSSLNLPETLRENQARGIPFRLPSAPNEVMVGP